MMFENMRYDRSYYMASGRIVDRTCRTFNNNLIVQFSECRETLMNMEIQFGRLIINKNKISGNERNRICVI